MCSTFLEPPFPCHQLLPTYNQLFRSAPQQRLAAARPWPLPPLPSRPRWMAAVDLSSGRPWVFPPKMNRKSTTRDGPPMSGDVASGDLGSVQQVEASISGNARRMRAPRRRRSLEASIDLYRECFGGVAWWAWWKGRATFGGFRLGVRGIIGIRGQKNHKTCLILEP